MQTAAYTTNTRGKYPLSTQTLDFIQSQVLLLQQLGFIGGSRYMLRWPDGTNDGLAFVDGELLTVAATPTLSASIKYCIVAERTEDIVADGDTYAEARRYKTARLSATAADTGCYAIGTFKKFLTNTALNDKIEQVPQTVYNYLADILAEKMPLLTIDGMTQEQLDGLRTACVANCQNSIKVVAAAANYSLHVTQMGNDVRQEITLPSGDKYMRMASDGAAWGAWTLITDNLHLEVKIDHGTVYLRHGELPADADIILLRKKRRSAYRRTGGNRAKAANRGVRQPRMPKTQYVHFKGIVLSKGTPNTWYVPHCISVANPTLDYNCINKEIAGLCRSFVIEYGTDADGNERYRMQGQRNIVSNIDGKHRHHQAYTKIALQVVRLKKRGFSISKQPGGEMVKLRYWLRRKYVVVETRYQCLRCGHIQFVLDDCQRCGHTQIKPIHRYGYVYYRTITQD